MKNARLKWIRTATIALTAAFILLEILVITDTLKVSHAVKAVLPALLVICVGVSFFLQTRTGPHGSQGVYRPDRRRETLPVPLPGGYRGLRLVKLAWLA